MKYAEKGNGNYGDDASLEGIEAEEGFGIPGQSAVGTVGAFRFADIGNEDENSTELVAPKRVTRVDVAGQPPVTNNEGLSSVSPGSLGTLINGVSEGKKMSLDARIAYVIENGEPLCNHCERNYIPTSLVRMACTHCGCGQPNVDHGVGTRDFSGADMALSHVEGETVADEARGQDIVKQESRKDFVNDMMLAFKKESNDSELYYMGYTDAQSSKPMNEDLALLSKDYYEGYRAHKFYNKTPQQSEGQSLYDIKPNSNSLPREKAGELTPGEEDRGPLELTDGFGHATASKKFASIYPIDVIEKFFGDN
jgi:hypothetical protein